MDNDFKSPIEQMAFEVSFRLVTDQVAAGIDRTMAELYVERQAARVSGETLFPSVNERLAAVHVMVGLLVDTFGSIDGFDHQRFIGICEGDAIGQED